MKLKQQLITTSSTWGFLVLFMALFRPDKLPVVFLIVPFVLLFFALYSTWHLLDSVRRQYFAKGNTDRPRRRLGLSICISLVLLLVLQSLGQLTARDVITVLAIVALGYVYLGRTVLGSGQV